METNVITLILKILFINIITFYVNQKIVSKNINYKKVCKLIIWSLAITLIYIISAKYIDNMLNIIVMYSLQVVSLKFIQKNDNNNLMVTNLIASAIVYTVLVILIHLVLVEIFFNIKRFKKGFAFVKYKINNEYASVILINISAIILLIYYMSGNYYGNLTKQIIVSLIVLGVLMLFTMQKVLTLYYKQKLLAKNIEDYKSEIALKDAQIKSLSDEKYKISKLNHEFYNRQKALIHKVEEITSMNTEIADELDLSKQINDLTKEYTDKAQEIKTLDKLPTTGIVEIDDMFKYMQSECDSKKIQFNLKINGNIYHMINNKIPQSRLVTLIGDHLRDAIIAIDFSNNTFKSILAVLGENNGVYEFCVFDTGIEFKIDTLLNLGLKPATTHKDSGGTGIGFMTTFETMKETKASLIIDEMREMSNTDYTKSVTIRFDGKNEYRIKSYRSDEIKKKMKDNRIIIENKKGSSTQWN